MVINSPNSAPRSPILSPRNVGPPRRRNAVIYTTSEANQHFSFLNEFAEELLNSPRSNTGSTEIPDARSSIVSVLSSSSSESHDDSINGNNNEISSSESLSSAGTKSDINDITKMLDKNLKIMNNDNITKNGTSTKNLKDNSSLDILTTSSDLLTLKTVTSRSDSNEVSNPDNLNVSHSSSTTAASNADTVCLKDIDKQRSMLKCESEK